MAIVKMKKLTLIALEAERKNLLDKFSHTANMHVIKMQQLDNTSVRLDVEHKDNLTHKMSMVNDCLLYIKSSLDKRQTEYVRNGDNKTKVGISLSGRKEEVDYDRFADFGKQEEHLFDNAINKSIQYEQRLRAIENEVHKQEAECEALQIYVNLDVPFCDIVDTLNTKMLLGVCTIDDDEFDRLCVDNDYAQFVRIGRNKSQMSLLVIYHREDEDKVIALISPYTFIDCSFNYATTAVNMIATINSNIDALKSEADSILDSSCQLKEYLLDLKTLYDYYYINRQICQTDESICRTASVFVLQAWLPADDVPSAESILAQNLSVYVHNFDEPTEDESVPTVIKMNKVMQPFASITQMYALPNYHEVDPNPVVAVFYWIFMGFMMGDVGYGVLMALLAIVFVKFMKAEGGFKNLMLVIGYSGVSTVIWGILFGGYFSAEGNLVPQPILFTALGNPLAMIEVCVIMGLVHLMTAMIMKAVNEFAKGRVWDGILDGLTWAGFDIGLIVVILGGFGSIAGSWSSPQLTTTGLILCASFLGIIVLTGGRKNKGLGKVIGGLGGIYNLINIMSDVLSYLRLFGLGLTTGVIGMVFNLLAGMLFAPFTSLLSIIGYIFGVVVLIIGHSLNLAISLLGAYIHDARLQHIEFFGKFYTGEGLPFEALGSKTKYIRIKN
ncbi:MAG: V-type ATP synthase subunit I [Clostridia bacterium]|nr:V-type ATP synthase subunit I [Clostridia bacterium]